MAEHFIRVNLEVDARFLKNGKMRPRRIIYGGKTFEITRVLDTRNYCPRVVSCVAPVEYLVLVEGVEKRIYFEAYTNSWFSVKEEI
ncbi:MAG: hypothetical protein IJ309_03970 [Clostridia bacterium]|nr:hypothetical protein [Clostridia bacterium]MBQ7907114.1 hypothetical protein [Clostridia bacterium]